MLSRKRCIPCTSETPRIEPERARALLAEAPGFELADDAARISRRVTFSSFHETMAFVNAVAYVAHREDHHPELEVGYGACRVTYTTHANGGLSENDFICAAKVAALLEP